MYAHVSEGIEMNLKNRNCGVRTVSYTHLDVYKRQDEYAALFEPVTVNIAEGQYLELFDAGSIERVSD